MTKNEAIKKWKGNATWPTPPVQAGTRSAAELTQRFPQWQRDEVWIFHVHSHHEIHSHQRHNYFNHQVWLMCRNSVIRDRHTWACRRQWHVDMKRQETVECHYKKSRIFQNKMCVCMFSLDSSGIVIIVVLLPCGCSVMSHDAMQRYIAVDQCV